MTRDTNLIPVVGSLPQAHLLHMWEGPPLVVLVRKTRDLVADMVEEAARALGLESFRSGVRDLEPVSDQLWGFVFEEIKRHRRPLYDVRFRFESAQWA